MFLNTHRQKIIATRVFAVFLAGALFPPDERFKTFDTDHAWAKTFRDELFSVDVNDINETGKPSKDLCTGIHSELKNGVKLEGGLPQVDTLMAQIGAHVGKSPAYVNNGYITYYFKPAETDLAMADATEKTVITFGGQSIGPGYQWLNPRWYKDNHSANLEAKARQMVKNEGPFITVRFETPFPLLDEFSKNGLLKKPPSHVANAAQGAGLKYVGSDRRDTFEYNYAIDMRYWYQKLFNIKRHYNVTFPISARRNADGTLDDLRISAVCKFPALTAMYAAPGEPPAAADVTMKPPVSIPSCPEYLNWFQGTNDPARDGCGSVSETPPACPAEAPLFPKTDYPLVK